MTWTPHQNSSLHSLLKISFSTFFFPIFFFFYHEGETQNEQLALKVKTWTARHIYSRKDCNYYIIYCVGWWRHGADVTRCLGCGSAHGLSAQDQNIQSINITAFTLRMIPALICRLMQLHLTSSFAAVIKITATRALWWDAVLKLWIDVIKCWNYGIKSNIFFYPRCRSETLVIKFKHWSSRLQSPKVVVIWSKIIVIVFGSWTLKNFRKIFFKMTKNSLFFFFFFLFVLKVDLKITSHLISHKYFSYDHESM